MVNYLKFSVLILGSLLLTLSGKAQCPTLSISIVNNVSCFGGFNGEARVNIQPDAPCGTGYSIMWSTGSNNALISGLSSGIYFVNVTNNCTGCTSFAIANINEPYLLSSTIVTTDANCKNQASGVVDLEVTGGTSTPSYTYEWGNGATTQDLTNVIAGTYTVTITDSKNCTTTNTAVVNEPASAVNNSSVVTNAKCFLGNDGAIDLTPFGGKPPYTFNWNSGTFLSEDINGLLQGAYSVIITDANGCAKTDQIIVQQPAAAIGSSTIPVDVLCNGGNTGSSNLTVTGGTAPYSFNWTSSSFTLGNVKDLNNVIADTYFVIITDANGCTKVDSTIIDEPFLLTSTEIHSHVNCFGGNDGSINITVTGGTLPYDFQWSNSNGILANTSEDLNNIPAETYTVLITDKKGCTTSQTVVITQPLSALTFNSTKNDVNCFGGNDGNIDITVTGGTLPHDFSWSNGAITEDLTNLFKGIYTITIIDAKGCVKIQGVTIDQPLVPMVITQAITDVTCFGGTNGSINITTSGGTSPYSYSWLNSSFSLSLTLEDILNFAADTYTVEITDANQCVLIDSFIINQPSEIILTLNKTDVLCFGNITGVVDLDVTGGNALYQYLWSNGAITEDITNVAAGWYSVTVSDNPNCIKTDSVEIFEPLAPLSSFHFTTPVTCSGGSDGAISVTVQDGTPPYSYLWSTGATISALNNIPAGNYTLTVTDANGCILIENINVPEPNFITITPTVTPVTCFGFNDGIILPIATGGTPSYSYFWTNSTFVLSANTQNVNNLPPDFYTLTVTDTNGCSGTVTVQVIEPLPLELNSINRDVSCNGADDGEIALNVTGGNPSYNYTWSNASNFSSISNLAPGIYDAIVTDTKNCTAVDTVTITEPKAITIDFETTIVSCKDQSDGKILLLPFGGNGDYTFLWNTGQTDNPLTNLAGGTYSLVATDILGCEGDTSIDVTINPRRCLDIPNAFTPNGDGINDTWMIDNIDLFDDAAINVYNEWGKIIFNGDRYSLWNGTFNGRELPSGTYYYIITVLSGTEPYTGSVTILK